MSTVQRSYSLYELVASVRRCIEANYNERYWIRAETSGVNLNIRSGHCYLELEERQEGGGCKARIKANIWRDTYEHIHRKFHLAGLKPLASGMNILCQVQVKYHEQYGISLLILDIDTEYSLGEIARQRQETINRLKREGIFDDNKHLELPQPLQRLAIVSSPTAAGYEDFLHQLKANNYQLQFYTALYQAQMQGEGTGGSIIAALERIAQDMQCFDAVVIIRGGGAVSELRAFDDYELCYYCTQYPLPIIAGIGHDRDVSILDMVANTSLKTPTAVAEFLVQYQLDLLQSLEDQALRLKQATNLMQTERQRQLLECSLRLPHLAGRILKQEQNKQSYLKEVLHQSAKRQLQSSRQQVEGHCTLLPYLVRTHLQRLSQHLEQSQQRLKLPIKAHQQRYLSQLQGYEQSIRLADPKNVLRRGFAWLEQKGRILSKDDALNTGDEVTIRLYDRALEAIIHKV